MKFVILHQIYLKIPTMRKISANYIYTSSGKVLNKGIIVVDSFGKIIDIVDTKGDLREIAGLEFYSGILVPGFVNAHCHLELSQMKNILDCRKQGLPKFIAQIIKKRFSPDNLQDFIKKADKEMYLEGIVAVGDISNNSDSFEVKKNSDIFYHTFVEVFTVNNQFSFETFRKAGDFVSKLKEYELKGNIVPHASYSVPQELWDLIKQNKPENKQVVSVHNMETASENMIFENKTGELYDTLQKLGFDFNHFSFTKKNSEQHTLSNLDRDDNILLIHNTYCTENDILEAKKFSENIYRVLCPDSNLFIENRLPDIEMMYKNDEKICIGTDSYSSNDRLSILTEMKAITRNFPQIPFEEILKWATINGAKALMIDDYAGSIEIGKTPGLNLISNFDFAGKKLCDKSELKKLI